MSTPSEAEVVWSIQLAASHAKVIRGLADDVQGEDSYNGPLHLTDSSAERWTVAFNKWAWKRELSGTADNLAALCRSLVGVGRKREREIAGRIKVRALGRGVAAEGWEGTPPDKAKGSPRDAVAVAAAWKAGKSLSIGAFRTDGESIFSWRLKIGATVNGKKIVVDHQGCISSSTSRHCGEALRVADQILQPHQASRRSAVGL